MDTPEAVTTTIGLINEAAAIPTNHRSALVVIPTYNENGNLQALLPRVWASADVDVLIIDDASPDGTGRVADQIAEAEPRLAVIHRAGKKGLASARLEGFAYAIRNDYDVSIEMDADLSHPPEVLPAMLRAMADADVVIGSRRVSGGRVIGRAFWRNALTILAGAYTRALLRLPVRDCTGGYRSIKVASLRKLALHRVGSQGYAYVIEVNQALHKAGAAFSEVPIIFRDRTVGQSKISARIILEALTVVPKLRLGLRHPALAARDDTRPASESKALVGHKSADVGAGSSQREAHIARNSRS